MSVQGATPWAAAARRQQVKPLPRPLEGIRLEQLRILSFPEHSMATVRQDFCVGLSKRRGAVLIDLKQSDLSGWTLGRENHGSPETVCAMLHHRFTPSRLQRKAIADRAVDGDQHRLSTPPNALKRNQDAAFMAQRILINRLARTATIIGEYVSSPPRLIHVGRHVILKQPYFLSLAKNGSFTFDVTQFKGVVKVQNFIKANHSLSANLLDELPRLKHKQQPIRVDNAKDLTPEIGAFLLDRFGHYRYGQRRWLPLTCQGMV